MRSKLSYSAEDTAEKGYELEIFPDFENFSEHDEQEITVDGAFVNLIDDDVSDVG